LEESPVVAGRQRIAKTYQAAKNPCAWNPIQFQSNLRETIARFIVHLLCFFPVRLDATRQSRRAEQRRRLAEWDGIKRWINRKGLI
jgi:hypothetical protein